LKTSAGFSTTLAGKNRIANPWAYTEDIDGPAVSALRRAIAEVKQHWSVIGWVTKIN
jgi:hypothetical protein